MSCTKCPQAPKVLKHGRCSIILSVQPAPPPAQAPMLVTGLNFNEISDALKIYWHLISISAGEY